MKIKIQCGFNRIQSKSTRWIGTQWKSKPNATSNATGTIKKCIINPIEIDSLSSKLIYRLSLWTNGLYKQSAWFSMFESFIKYGVHLLQSEILKLLMFSVQLSTVTIITPISYPDYHKDLSWGNVARCDKFVKVKTSNCKNHFI